MFVNWAPCTDTIPEALATRFTCFSGDNFPRSGTNLKGTFASQRACRIGAIVPDRESNNRLRTDRCTMRTYELLYSELGSCRWDRSTFVRMAADNLIMGGTNG